MKAVLALLLVACGSDPGVDTSPISYSTIGPLVGDAGKGSWRFGVASAATQVEDMNPNTDWYEFTQPTAQGGLGRGTDFVGDAVKGYTMDLDDVGLVSDLGMDSYRFSIEWARIEPQKGVIDEDAIAHYRAELLALAAKGIRPLVTIHHYSNPIWVYDLHDVACANGPSDTNLCGFGGPGGAQIVQAMADHAKLLAQRFGDLVDEWGTVNEPVSYLFAAYGVGYFPPGKTALTNPVALLVPPLRDYLAAQAAMYHAIKDNDLIDADGDGIAAAVGFSMSVADWEPARANKPSTDPDDIKARDYLIYLFHYMYVDAAITGGFDTDLDGTPDEMHPEWANTIDWLGLQYYFRAGVSGDRPLFVGVAPCTTGLDNGACLPAPDPTYCSPRMGYEAWPDGIRTVIEGFAKRYPTMPLLISESGIASNVGKRHAETVVKILEAVEQERKAGADIRGYYHWSLTDNFEWAEGFGPHFGLYSVDDNTYVRTPTEGATVLGAIAASRSVTADQRNTYGGLGPMSAETGADDSNPYCYKQ
jgi:beta-glucosidase/6-phospho-beta-glucosidase/beta-galactosidase